MSTLSAIERAVREVQSFLHYKLSDQLINSVQNTLNIIQTTLGDPHVQANIKVALEELKALLKEAEKAKIIEEISTLLRRASEILQEVDPNTIQNIITTINKLVSEAANVNVIQNITKALNSVASLQELVKFANELILPAKCLLYGTTGAMLGIVLKQVIQAYFQNKKDKKLQESIDKLVAINMQQLIVQIQQLRIQAGGFVLSADLAEHENPDFSMRQELRNLREENIIMLHVLLPIDINETELMQKVQVLFSEVLNKLYKLELNDEEVSVYLNRIGSNMTSWDALIDYVTYYPQLPLFQKDRPRLPRDDLNYQQVKKRYGAVRIEPIMKGLIKNIIENGGEELFYKLANTFEDAAYCFAECLKQISQKDIDFTFSETEWKNGAQKMLHYYHKANEYIDIQWEQTTWDDEYSHIEKPLLTEQAQDIIRARAYIEFCRQTAPYLCFPRNVPREIYNGVIDLPFGLYHTVRHPLQTAINLGTTFFTVDGWKNTGSRVYFHPIRFFTTQAVAAGVSIGASHILHQAAVIPSAKAATVTGAKSLSAHTAAAHPATTHTLLAHPATTHAATTHTVASQASATSITVETGLAAGSGVLSNVSAQNSNIVTIEEKTSQQPENDAPLITPELFLQLITRFGEVGDLISMYDEMLDWYGKINSSDLAFQTSVSSPILEKDLIITENTMPDKGNGTLVRCYNKIELLKKYAFLSRKQNPEQSLVLSANKQQCNEPNEPQRHEDNSGDLRYRGK